MKEGRDCCGTGAQVMMDHTICYELSVRSVWHKAWTQHKGFWLLPTLHEITGIQYAITYADLQTRHHS